VIEINVFLDLNKSKEMNEWNIKKMINASLRVKEKDNMGKMENVYYSTQSAEINIKLTE
ncbi:hypothetical protein MUG91_G5n215, partial [Manis pentadactyla]